MEPLKPHERGRSTKGPEAKVEASIIRFLEGRGWYVRRIHGSSYQAGLPDLMACHPRYGIRLIEVKDPNRRGRMFTPAQENTFPKLIRHGAPVLVLDGIDTYKYQIVLENKSNFFEYITPIKELRPYNRRK